MRRGRRPAAALSPTTRPRRPSNALPSTMNSGTHQPKIIHWCDVCQGSIVIKHRWVTTWVIWFSVLCCWYCQAFLFLDLFVLVYEQVIRQSDIWPLSFSALSSAQEVSPYSRDETESCRSGNSSFTSLIDSLHSLCFPSSNVKIKKKEILPPFIVEYALPLLPQINWMWESAGTKLRIWPASVRVDSM